MGKFFLTVRSREEHSVGT